MTSPPNLIERVTFQPSIYVRGRDGVLCRPWVTLELDCFSHLIIRFQINSEPIDDVGPLDAPSWG